MSHLKVSDILRVKEPADRVHMSISSDGKWLAFCLSGKKQDKNSKGVSQVVEGNAQWVCNLITGDSFPIARQAKSSWAGVWSPKGLTLAFFADINNVAQVWLWTPTNKSLKLASEIIVRPFFGFEKPIWTKDSSHIIVKSMPKEQVDDTYFNSSIISPNELSHYKSSKPISYSTNFLKNHDYKGINNNWVNRYKSDISMINIKTKQHHTICRGFHPVGMSISTNGKYIAFTNCLGEIPNTQQNEYDLWICSVHFSNESNPIKIVKNLKLEYGLNFTWAYDDRSILYTKSGPLSEGGLWSVDTKLPYSSKLLHFSTDIHFGREYDAPLSLENGDIILLGNGKLFIYTISREQVEKIITVKGREIVAILPFSNQDNCVIVQTIEKQNALYGFYKINYESDFIEKIIEEPKGHLPWYEGGAFYKKIQELEYISYFSQSGDEPPNLTLLEVNSKTIVKHTKVNSINTSEFGKSELIFWNHGNKRVRGALLLPKNQKGRVPIIIRGYGGAMLSNRVRYFGLSTSAADNHQLFALKGYGVFLPDLPMSRSHEPAEEIKLSIDNALTELIKHPAIDPERIGIIGHSFGGYSALVAITRIQRFKAAVISAGVGNLISMYTKFDYPNFNYGFVENGLPNMEVNLWEDTQRYIRNSPLFELQNIEAPVLIVQGTRDHLCNEEAGPIFTSLNRLGKNAELVLYDEGHWQGTWSEENLQDYYKRVVQWFDQHL